MVGGNSHDKCKKRLILTTIGLIGGGYAIYKNIDKETSKYSLEWITGLSDDQWSKEREIGQNNFRNSELDIAFRENCHKILGLFDKVKSARDWAGKTPQGPTYHREHGFGLYHYLISDY